MILVCALLFSCATSDEAASPAADREAGIPTVASSLSEDTGSASGKNSAALGRKLSAVPVYAEWAAAYVPELHPVFNGVQLIPDNSAFDSMPADVKARRDKAEDFCNQNRFLDAWYAYGEDDNEYIIALKILHLLDCHTDTIMHQIFVLSNLEPDQNLNEYRNSFSQTGEKIFWDPVEAVDTYTAEKCGGVIPHILELAMGCYFESAAIIFGDEWTVPLEDVYELAVEYFTRAIAAGVYNDYTLYMSVDSFLSAGYYTDALEILHCLELGDPEYGFHYYQEAMAHMCLGDYDKAKAASAKAALFSPEVADLAAAVRVFSDAFMYDGRQTDNALNVIEAAKPLIQQVYYEDTVFQALDIMLFAKINGFTDRKYDDAIRSEMTAAFAAYSEEADYLWTLTEYFYNYDQIPLGIQWITSVLPDWEDTPIAAGNLYYELGQFYMQFDEYQLALDAMNRCEELLTEAGVFDPERTNVTYYQKYCSEQLLIQSKGNGI